MADMKPAMPYDQLIAELAGLVATGSTGTLFITSTDNRAIRFQLQDGEIVSCFYGPKQGPEALQRIASIGGGSFRFDPALPPTVADRALPTTDMILADLGHLPSRKALEGGHAAKPAPAKPPRSAPTPRPAPPPAEDIDHDLQQAFMETTGLFDPAAEAARMQVPHAEFALATDLLTMEFACFVGPVASVWTMNYVVINGPPATGEALRLLIEAMAREIQIHDRNRVRDFIQRVRQRLEPIL